MKLEKNKIKKKQKESDKYQDIIAGLLKKVFPNNEIIKEWDSASFEKKKKGPKKTYVPRTDIAVGPFNSLNNIKLGQDGTAVMKNSPLVRRLNERYNIVWNDLSRCFLAIEVVFSGSSKHIMGDFLNATSIGAVGIVVCKDKEYKTAKRILSYLDKLEEFKRIDKRAMRNLMLFNEVDFIKFLEDLADPNKNEELNINEKYKISNKLIFYTYSTWTGSDLTDDIDQKLTLYGFNASKLLRSYDIIFQVTDYTYPSVVRFHEFYDQVLSKNIKTLNIIDIAVKEKFRRKGIGSKILSVFEKIAKANDCNYICVETVGSASNSSLEVQSNFLQNNNFELLNSNNKKSSSSIFKKSLL